MMGDTVDFISASLPSHELNKAKVVLQVDYPGRIKRRNSFATNTGRLYRFPPQSATWERCRHLTVILLHWASKRIDGYCVDLTSINQTLDGGIHGRKQSHDIKQSDEQTMQTVPFTSVQAISSWLAAQDTWVSNDARQDICGRIAVWRYPF